MDPGTSVQTQLKEIDVMLKDIDRKMESLKDKKQILLARKESLKDAYMLEQTKSRMAENWSGTDFKWSAKMFEVMKSVFKVSKLRPFQLEAINATMSKEDVILIMPTGGGKSLCYQLPALLCDGITLVVSPLISLMEDQVAALKRLGVDAVMLSASSSKEESKKASDALQDSRSGVRLLYVTPERLAKSKRFMNQLQKCAAAGRFARLAIDEVHCCSTWGHDFRPDYNYLGVLKDMFPITPILGLTATSTSKVTMDVQKMLSLEKALVLRAPFNRPNLFYSVLQKPDQKEACADLVADWLKQRFRGQTGIIYTTTIKDCQDFATELKNRGIKVGVYHASMEGPSRSRTHERWMSGSIQVVVATIAFGLGIDKPDVRFVIHHALSKSMEMLYQESGRAGRDGKPAHCIILYRLADVFKLSTMVFTQRTGLENLYGIVQYCLNSHQCRRSIIASYFNEVWEPEQCKNMCDSCRSKIEHKEVDIIKHCRTLYRILEFAAQQDRQLTANKLIEAWMHQGEAKLRVKDVRPPGFDRTLSESVVAHLLVHGYLKEDFHYTAYSTISYLRKGVKSGEVINRKDFGLKVNIAKLRQDLNFQLDLREIDSGRVKNGNKSTAAVKRTEKEIVDLSDEEQTKPSADEKVVNLSDDEQEKPLSKKEVVDVSDDDDEQPHSKRKRLDLFGSDESE